MTVTTLTRAAQEFKFNSAGYAVPSEAIGIGTPILSLSHGMALVHEGFIEGFECYCNNPGSAAERVLYQVRPRTDDAVTVTVFDRIGRVADTRRFEYTGPDLDRIHTSYEVATSQWTDLYYRALSA